MPRKLLINRISKWNPFQTGIGNKTVSGFDVERISDKFLSL